MRGQRFAVVPPGEGDEGAWARICCSATSAASALLHTRRPACLPLPAGCFAVGTDQGFRIYNCEPFKETFRRDCASGGIGQVEMLFRCNILALVGGGRNPRYPSHKVMIWDDHQNRCIGELSFRSEVRAVRLRRDRVVVVLSSKVYVYNFADLSLLDHIETAENSKGGWVGGGGLACVVVVGGGSLAAARCTRSHPNEDNIPNGAAWAEARACAEHFLTIRI